MPVPSQRNGQLLLRPVFTPLKSLLRPLLKPLLKFTSNYPPEIRRIFRHGMWMVLRSLRCAS
jgi:hypothetical protein